MPGKLDDNLPSLCWPFSVYVAAIDNGFAFHMQHLVTLLNLTIVIETNLPMLLVLNHL
jgi:hypothetical protein